MLNYGYLHLHAIPCKILVKLTFKEHVYLNPGEDSRVIMLIKVRAMGVVVM